MLPAAALASSMMPAISEEFSSKDLAKVVNDVTAERTASGSTLAISVSTLPREVLRFAENSLMPLAASEASATIVSNFPEALARFSLNFSTFSTLFLTLSGSTAPIRVSALVLRVSRRADKVVRPLAALDASARNVSILLELFFKASVNVATFAMDVLMLASFVSTSFSTLARRLSARDMIRRAPDIKSCSAELLAVSSGISSWSSKSGNFGSPPVISTLPTPVKP